MIKAEARYGIGATLKMDPTFQKVCETAALWDVGNSGFVPGKAPVSASCVRLRVRLALASMRVAMFIQARSSAQNPERPLVLGNQDAQLERLGLRRVWKIVRIFDHGPRSG